MSQTLMGYGFVSDTDDSLKTKTGGEFGLNQNVRVTKFAYNPNVAKQGDAPREALEIVVMVKEKEFKDWISPVNKVFGPNQTEIPAPLAGQAPSPEYIAGYNTQIIQQNAVVVHYLKALGVPEESIRPLLQSATSFADWAQKASSLLPPNYASIPVDVFLEFQSNIGTGANKTWPTLPRNMKGGYFIVPTVIGDFEEKRTEESLTYVNKATGAEHPFTRDKNFVNSDKAKEKTTAGTASGNAGNPGPQGGGAPVDAPAPATWR